MTNIHLKFSILEDFYSICKLKELPSIPAGMISDDFFSITRTTEEISVVVKSSGTNLKPEQVSHDWRILKITDPLDLSMTGILAMFTDVLKKEDIPVFVISTFNTDYILIKQDYLDRAVDELCRAGQILVS